MRSLIKVLLTAFSIASCLLAITGPSQAQSVKIGFINDEEIKQSYPEWTRAQEQMDIELKAWNDEALAKDTELAELIEEYDKQKLILSEEKKKEREAAIRAKRDALDAFTRQVFGPGGLGERKNEELIVPLLNKINRAIQIVAEEGDLDVVFTLQSALGYIKPTLDITDQVLQTVETLED